MVAWRLRDRSPSELYAHFADRAAVVALVASRLLGCPYSLSIHAGADIFVHPVLLREKIEHARGVVTCTEANRTRIASIVGAALGDKVATCGTACRSRSTDRRRPGSTASRRRWCSPSASSARRRGSPISSTPATACAPAARRSVQDHRRRAAPRCTPGPDPRCSTRRHVVLIGALPQEDVVAWYRQAGVFVLPCVVTPDGQVDGIPNVVPEAMAMGVPIVSSDAARDPRARRRRASTVCSWHRVTPMRWPRQSADSSTTRNSPPGWQGPVVGRLWSTSMWKGTSTTSWPNCGPSGWSRRPYGG